MKLVALAADGIGDLEQQRPQQVFGRIEGRPSCRAYRGGESGRQRGEDRIDQLAHRPQGVVVRNAIFHTER